MFKTQAHNLELGFKLTWLDSQAHSLTTGLPSLMRSGQHCGPFGDHACAVFAAMFERLNLRPCGKPVSLVLSLRPPAL